MDGSGNFPKMPGRVALLVLKPSEIPAITDDQLRLQDFFFHQQLWSRAANQGGERCLCLTKTPCYITDGWLQVESRILLLNTW